MVSLSQILSERRLNNDVVHFVATGDWAQGRTCFGGFLTALSVVAMRDTMAIDSPLRSVHTNFIGPVPPGDVECRTQLLRQGKNVAQVRCELFSDDALCGVVIGVFGVARESTLPSRTPKYQSPERSVNECSPLNFIAGVSPNFLQHIELRWVEGGLPFSQSGDWSSQIYLRTVDEDLSPELQAVLLSDGPPTPALSFFSGPATASSVAWSLEFPPLPTEKVAQGWFQIDMSVISASEGYTNVSAKLWTPDGSLVSLSHQVVTVFG